MAKLPPTIFDDVLPCPDCGIDLRGNCGLHISTALDVQFMLECLSCGKRHEGTALIPDTDDEFKCMKCNGDCRVDDTTCVDRWEESGQADDDMAAED
jgi:hypothetical protein